MTALFCIVTVSKGMGCRGSLFWELSGLNGKIFCIVTLSKGISLKYRNQKEIVVEMFCMFVVFITIVYRQSMFVYCLEK
jgi:hypothetical protein